MKTFFYSILILFTAGVFIIVFLEYKKSVTHNDSVPMEITRTETASSTSESQTPQEQTVPQALSDVEIPQTKQVVPKATSTVVTPAQNIASEKPLVRGEGTVDANGLLTYSNEKYGFEFKYPSSIAPIIFSEEDGSNHLLALVFYDREIVVESLAKDPPDKKPMAKVIVSMELIITENEKPEVSVREFIRSRNYSELEPSFKDVTGGDFEAMEIVDQPEKGYMLIVKVSARSFLEIGSRKNLEIHNQIKPTFKSI
jgi:hypothetical protein